ncbi:MAG: hypothetical protein U0360_08610 [Dehalococcoidia bacterium]
MRTTGHSFRLAAFTLVLVSVLGGACGTPPSSPSPAVVLTPETTAPPTTVPSPVLTSTPQAASGAPRAIETVVPSTEIADSLGRAEAAVRRIRGRGVDRPVNRSFVTSAGMRAVIDRALEDADDLADLRSEGNLLEALGQLPRGFDIVEAYRQLLGSEVLGLRPEGEGVVRARERADGRPRAVDVRPRVRACTAGSAFRPAGDHRGHEGKS